MNEERAPYSEEPMSAAGNGSERASHLREGVPESGRFVTDDARGAAELADLKDRLRWVSADFENLRKRFDRELARQRAQERAEGALQWLPVLDNLERALDHAGADGEALIEGVRAVRDQAVAVLAGLGFPRYEDVGHLFDPVHDEALGTVTDDQASGTVVATLRPGYGTEDAVLRPAGVIVSKGHD